uniref:Uncharacterized protein n=1 Tax=Plectus sambesii TaxID=2011161 RepID=A0A914USB5_9BILA
MGSESDKRIGPTRNGYSGADPRRRPRATADRRPPRAVNNIVRIERVGAGRQRPWRHRRRSLPKADARTTPVTAGPYPSSSSSSSTLRKLCETAPPLLQAALKSTRSKPQDASGGFVDGYRSGAAAVFALRFLSKQRALIRRAVRVGRCADAQAAVSFRRALGEQYFA